MQRILKRAAYVRKRAVEKYAKKKDARDRTQLSMENNGAHASYIVEINRQDNVRRKEQWDSVYRGQLAPRYDVGKYESTYGAVTGQSLQAHYGKKLEKNQAECPFAVGDRVVVANKKHREAGKIGKITEIDLVRQTVQLEGINEVNVYLPESQRKLMRMEEPYVKECRSIRITDCRLIWHQEGEDVIVRQIALRKPSYREKQEGITKSQRFVPGTSPLMYLQWPEEKEPEYEDADADTLRIEVEERTWVPSLGIPPMPPNVIDELRNKYSKFRTRFDDEFIEKKNAEVKAVEDKAQALKLAAKTPIDELNSKLRKEKRKAARTRPRLTPEIIEAMARFGLENAEQTGRELPAKTRTKFQLIQEGFPNDSAAVKILPEDQIEQDLKDQDEEGWEDIDPSMQDEVEVPVDRLRP